MSPAATITDPVLIDFAAQVGDQGPVAVQGSRTRWDLGGPVEPDVCLLSAPSGIVEYVPEEMTVQVRAGTTVAELHHELAQAGQRTGLPERGGTVGGAIAVGENGLYVAARGRVRDAVLQVRYVSDDARLVTGGGPTVKNVTGFDLPRLMVGALGTLGLLAEVTLRTNPIPAVTTWVTSDGLDPFAVRDHVLAPSAVLWDGTSTWVQVEGHPPAVAADLERLGALAPVAEVEGPPALPQHRWSLRPADLADAAWLVAVGTQRWVASVGVGTVWCERPQPPRPLDSGVAELAARVKAQFDPHGRLNPGRVPGRTS